MLKPVQKRPSAPSIEAKSCTPASDHDYGVGMECNVQVVSEEDFPPLPVTPSKPPIAKKTTISHVGLGSALNSDDAVCTLINLINSRSDKIEKMVESVCVEIKDLNEKFITIEKRVERSEETTTE